MRIAYHRQSIAFLIYIPTFATMAVCISGYNKWVNIWILSGQGAQDIELKPKLGKLAKFLCITGKGYFPRLASNIC